MMAFIFTGLSIRKNTPEKQCGSGVKKAGNRLYQYDRH